MPGNAGISASTRNNHDEQRETSKFKQQNVNIHISYFPFFVSNLLFTIFWSVRLEQQDQML